MTKANRTTTLDTKTIAAKTVRPLMLSLLAALAVLPATRVRAQATSGSVTVNGAHIAYRVQGHGPALMLVHGFPLSGELFAVMA